mgnify:CR=1 FL=1
MTTKTTAVSREDLIAENTGLRKLIESFEEFDADLACEYALFNKLSCSEKLEAPQVESEPVAMVVSKYGDPEAFGERELKVFVDLSTIAYDTPLFLKSQASVAVLPEPCAYLTINPYGICQLSVGKTHAHSIALTQLEDVAKLNATPVPIGLLRRVCQPICCDDDHEVYEQAIEELRELIK